MNDAIRESNPVFDPPVATGRYGQRMKPQASRAICGNAWNAHADSEMMYRLLLLISELLTSLNIISDWRHGKYGNRTH